MIKARLTVTNKLNTSEGASRLLYLLITARNIEIGRRRVRHICHRGCDDFGAHLPMDNINVRELDELYNN